MSKASFVRILIPCLLGLTVLGTACVAAPGSGEDIAEETETVVGKLEIEAPVEIDDPGGAAKACVVPTDGTRPDPTLVITDPTVLARFPLNRVVQQLVDLAGAGSVQTGTLLYRQLWDSFDTTANAAFPGTPHCDDPGINGFPLDCGATGRPEVAFKTTNTGIFTPVALMNRFDLAPASGAHCGEYRIIYARTGGSFGGRDFIIFEGALPNPDPSCGIESCRPVVDFWENLENLKPNSSALADALDAFYFTGSNGFEPVVHPGHYGSSGGGGYGATGAGQIRTNLFLNNVNWQLREHHLTQPCGVKKLAVPGLPPVPCKLVMTPVTDKSNPFKSLFSASSTDPRAAQFQADFPAQVAALASDDVNLIGLATADTFNAGQSNSQVSSERYQSQLPPVGVSNLFTLAIGAELAAIGRTDLTPRDIASRATTQSCAGCHQLSPTNFGGGTLGGSVNPSWPSSRGFVHVDESGFLSPALWCTFLPFRKSVLDAFASSKPELCADAATKASQSDGSTIAGKLPGAN